MSTHADVAPEAPNRPKEARREQTERHEMKEKIGDAGAVLGGVCAPVEECYCAYREHKKDDNTSSPRQAEILPAGAFGEWTTGTQTGGDNGHDPRHERAAPMI